MAGNYPNQEQPPPAPERFSEIRRPRKKTPWVAWLPGFSFYFYQLFGDCLKLRYS